MYVLETIKAKALIKFQTELLKKNNTIYAFRLILLYSPSMV
jgi:hypothetical protein